MIFEININMTPLHFASQNGHFEVVKVLLTAPSIEVNCKAIEFNISFHSNLIFYYIQI